MSTRWGWLFGIALTVASGSTNCAQAQIVSDRTQGTEASRLTPNVLVNGAATDRISGGAQRGGNLFHSFSQFNVSEGQRVYFVNPSGIQNILTRVTGGQASNILGTLGVEGSANLFLLNPNGIMFGPNARLDVRGSFLGTTANSFVFPNGIEFSATNPQAPPLLTINVPIGLQFGSQPGRITSFAVSRNEQGSAVDGLSVGSGSSLSLIGGEIALDGSALFASNGRVLLGAVGLDTTVGLQVNGSSLDFSLPETARRSPITLTNGALVGTTGDSVIKLVGGQIGLNVSSLFGLDGGAISIDTNQLSLDNRSLIATATQVATKAGDIQIQASDAVTVANRSQIFSQSTTSATGNGGDVAINAKTIAIAGDGTSTRSLIQTLTQGEGNGGNLSLNAKESVNINGGFVSVSTIGAGNGGNLSLNAKESVNINGGFVSVSTIGAGNGGDLSVRTGNGVNVTDGGVLSLFSDSSGSTGNLRIETGTLRVQNSGRSGGVSGLANGSGSVGSISIQARDAVEVIDGIINTGVVSSATGQAGDVAIDTQRVNLINGGVISTSTFTNANAGNIVIRANDSVDIRGISSDVSPSIDVQGSRVSSTTFTATGNGGNVAIETPRLTLSQGGGVTTASIQSRGNAGNITIRAKDVELDGFATSPRSGLSFLSELNSQVFDSEADVRSGKISVDTELLRLSNGANINTSVTGKGNGNDIQISARSVSLTNNAKLEASNAGQGNAGNILVQAQDDIVANNSFIRSNIGSSERQPARGNVGNIQLEAGSVSFTNGAQLQAGFYSGGQGNSGIVSIKARDTVSFAGRNSGISTNAESMAVGNGSDIQISARSVSLTDGAILEASNAGQGNAGNILVQAQDNISADNSLINSNIGRPERQPARGNVGNIQLEAGSISFTNGAQLQAGFYSGGQGNPGIVSIKARDTVSFAGRDSGIFTNVESMAVGNGSDVQISARSVSFTNGAVLEASNAGRGNGGNITIQAGTLSIDGSIAISTLQEGGVGNAGDVNISTRSLSLTNRGQLSTSNVGNGAAGNINIMTAQDIRLDNEGSIRADTRGGQGNISVLSRNFILSRNSNITTNATGNNVIGGNIKIDTGILAAVENSNISANSADARGGRVTINTQSGIFRSPDSTITATGASSFLNGTVQINSPEVDSSLGLVTLPTFTENTPRLVSSSCAAFADQGGSKFMVTGRSGLPPSPDEFLTSDVVWTDTRLPDTTVQQHLSKKHIASQSKAVEIVPATGWVLNGNGEVTLISNKSGVNIGSTPTNCPK